MKLLRLQIENFGKLQGYTLSFQEGLNTVYAENGFGKSTIAAFIKAMFYGLPASTKRNLDKNERKKYTPWQGGNLGGSLEFESELGRFRIERFFAIKEASDEFRLFDLSTNKPSDAYSADVGIELFGIDAEGFARSAFLSQNGMDNTEENVSVTAKLTGLLEDVNDIGSYDVAMEAIDKRRKVYEVKGGRGRVSDLNAALVDGRRELERLRECLAQQKTQEQKLEEIRKSISTTEQEFTRLQEQLRLAELRKNHLQEQQRLKACIEETESKKNDILDAFQNRIIPTDEKLANAQRLLKEFRIEQGKCDALCLSNEEQKTLTRLQRQYQKGRPTPQLLSKLQNTIRAESEANALLQASPIMEPTSEQRRFASTGIPSSVQLEEAEKKLNQAEGLEKEIERNRTEGQKNKQKKILFALAVTFLPLGVLTFATAFLFQAVQTMLLIFGGITMAAGAILLYLSKNRKAERKRQETLQSMEMQRQTMLSDVQTFLKRYGSLPQNQNLQQGLRQLRSATDRAAEDEKRQQEQENKREKLRLRILEQRKQQRSLFEACGIPQLPADPHGALLKIHTDLREWDALLQKHRTLQEQAQQMRSELAQKQSELSAFLNRLTRTDTNQPEARLEQIERLSRDHAILLGTLRRQRQDLKDREEQYAQKAPKNLPSDATLTSQQQELSKRLEMLHREETEILRIWNQCTEQTKRIPLLEDELSHLSVERAEAEHRLELLRRTAQFLTESKEALSTRYLGGMQSHFEQFRQLAEGDSSSEAHMDTSFSVSVHEAGKSRVLESFSRGSRDILQFCARLALTMSMFEEGERPFLILDDPFVNLDEQRFASIRRLLNQLSEEFQILYLVCHRDRC